jgi:hypothetical protein
MLTTIQFLINDSDLQREMMDEMDDVTTAIRHWGNIEYLHMRSNIGSPPNCHDSVEDYLVNLYKSILAFKVCLSSICKQGTTGDLSCAFRDSYDKRLTMLVQIAKAAGTIEQLKRTYKSFKDCESQCKRALDDCQKINDEHKKICDWISDYQTEKAYMNMCERIELDKYPGCGQWLLDMSEYKDWTAGRSGILWIQGTGKQHISTF